MLGGRVRHQHSHKTGTNTRERWGGSVRHACCARRKQQRTCDSHHCCAKSACTCMHNAAARVITPPYLGITHDHPPDHASSRARAAAAENTNSSSKQQPSNMALSGVRMPAATQAPSRALHAPAGKLFAPLIFALAPIARSAKISAGSRPRSSFSSRPTHTQFLRASIA